MKRFYNSVLLLWVATIVFFMFFAFAVTGCSQKTKVITKYKYIEKRCPQLKYYDFNKTLSLTAYNSGDKICVKEWDGCIKKDSFLELFRYIKEMKKIIKNYQAEVKEYNRWNTKNK